MRLVQNFLRRSRFGQGSRKALRGVRNGVGWWRVWAALGLWLVLWGCTRTAAPTTSTAPATLTPPGPPPTPQVFVTKAPSPEPTARAFFQAWNQGNYRAMYRLLSQASQDAVDFETFREFVHHVWFEAALSRVEYEPLSVVMGTEKAQLQYRLRLQSQVVGEIVRENTMHFRMEEGGWRILWDEGLFLPELRGGFRLRLDLIMPLRGDIYDREGLVLAAQTQAYAIGVIPSQINPDLEFRMARLLAQITGRDVEDIRGLYLVENPPWYVPIAEVSSEKIGPYLTDLQSFPGMVLRPYFGRMYFFGKDTAHVVGYVSPIQPEEVEELRSRGYSPAARVGRMGLERWGEDYLRGESGGALVVVDAEDPTRAHGVIAQRDPGLSSHITSTLDANFQDWVCFAIKDFAGAAVVLERDTGRVLAMCSSPSFNPHAFEPDNFNSQIQRTAILQDPNKPFINRATMGLYPPGSTFKIITLAAALETGLFSLDSIYDCQYEFTELQGLVLYDWTKEYELPPSGPLNPVEGLMRSCNPMFWHMGLALYNRGLFGKVHELARAFGLGQPTGIEIEEEEGLIPARVEEPLDAVNQAIGQGDILVTPLQMARLMAALGNGGRLLRPALVERVEAPDGSAVVAFEPEEQGRLPVRPEVLAALWDGLYRVVQDRRGTAYHVFLNFPIPVYGKTGTAENPQGKPHAWFVAFTDAQNPDKPDIALAVLLEHGGSGGNVAAPVARRILEVYFFNRPQILYPWEVAIGETPTPTPIPTPTPVPTPEAGGQEGGG